MQARGATTANRRLGRNDALPGDERQQCQYTGGANRVPLPSALGSVSCAHLRTLQRPALGSVVSRRLFLRPVVRRITVKFPTIITFHTLVSSGWMAAIGPVSLIALFGVIRQDGGVDHRNKKVNRHTAAEGVRQQPASGGNWRMSHAEAVAIPSGGGGNGSRDQPGLVRGARRPRGAGRGGPARPRRSPALRSSVPAEPQGFFGKLCAQCDACRRKLCMTPAGAMLNSMTQPLTMATGGIIPPFCPIVPSAADLAKPGVAGASDAIKKDALEAKMRRDKVRFLGTVDCRYYPDAIGALTAALRTDGSECVRYEAALALNRGCCCNQKTIDALEASVSGTDKDGNPAERSVRVRCTAATALEPVCRAICRRRSAGSIEPKIEPKPIEPLPLPTEKKKPIDAASAKATDGEKKGNPDLRLPSKASVEKAWQTLNDFNALLAAEAPMAAVAAKVKTSVYQIIRDAIDAAGTHRGPSRRAASLPTADGDRSRHADLPGADRPPHATGPSRDADEDGDSFAHAHESDHRPASTESARPPRCPVLPPCPRACRIRRIGHAANVASRTG